MRFIKFHSTAFLKSFQWRDVKVNFRKTLCKAHNSFCHRRSRGRCCLVAGAANQVKVGHRVLERKLNVYVSVAGVPQYLYFLNLYVFISWNQHSNVTFNTMSECLIKVINCFFRSHITGAYFLHKDYAKVIMKTSEVYWSWVILLLIYINKKECMFRFFL